MQGTGTAAPAGWYADPADPGRQRWWGGTAWTTATRPVAATRVLISPTERTVRGMTTQGVALAHRYYGRFAGAGLIVRTVVAVVAVLVLGAVLAAGPIPFGGLAFAVLLCLLVQGLLFELVRFRRVRGIIRSLPPDGAVAPGEVEGRLYDATWRLALLDAFASTVLVVALALWFLWALGSGAVPGGGTTAVWFVLLALAAGVLVGLLDLREWRTKSAVAAGRLTPAIASRPARGSTASAAGSSTSLATAGRGAAGAGESVVCWAAPVMQVWVPGTAMGIGGWTALGGAYHDAMPQNTIVVTGSALYVLAAYPPSLAAAVGDSDVYMRMKTDMFYSGVEIREAAQALLSQGMAAAAAWDPRCLRIRLSDIEALESTPGSPAFSLQLRNRPTMRFILNHADVTAAFLGEAATAGLPVRWVAKERRRLLAPDLVAEIPDAVLRLAGVLLLLVGLVLTPFMGLVLVGNVWRAGLTEHATGTVTSLVIAPPLAKAVSGVPVIPDCVATVRFVAGRAQHVVSDPHSGTASHCGWKVGDQVAVSYRPGDPGQAEIGTPTWRDAVLPALLVAIGLLLLSVGGVLAFRPRLITDRIGEPRRRGAPQTHTR